MGSIISGITRCVSNTIFMQSSFRGLNESSILSQNESGGDREINSSSEGANSFSRYTFGLIAACQCCLIRSKSSQSEEHAPKIEAAASSTAASSTAASQTLGSLTAEVAPQRPQPPAGEHQDSVVGSLENKVSEDNGREIMTRVFEYLVKSNSKEAVDLEELGRLFDSLMKKLDTDQGTITLLEVIILSLKDQIVLKDSLITHIVIPNILNNQDKLTMLLSMAVKSGEEGQQFVTTVLNRLKSKVDLKNGPNLQEISMLSRMFMEGLEVEDSNLGNSSLGNSNCIKLALELQGVDYYTVDSEGWQPWMYALFYFSTKDSLDNANKVVEKLDLDKVMTELLKKDKVNSINDPVNDVCTVVDDFVRNILVIQFKNSVQSDFMEYYKEKYGDQGERDPVKKLLEKFQSGDSFKGVSDYVKKGLTDHCYNNTADDHQDIYNGILFPRGRLT